jgi:predicted methyltransferase
LIEKMVAQMDRTRQAMPRNYREAMRIVMPWVASAALSVAFWTSAYADVPDRFDAAVAHPGRSEADRMRDLTDRPAEVLRLTGIAPGMRVADLLAFDGYYSELLSYLVGSHGRVLLINNDAYDRWSRGLAERLSDNRLPNVEHLTVDLNHMRLKEGSLDAVLLVKVYHELYWIDRKRQWPAINVGAVIDQVARALKPDGVLLVVDHSAKAGTGSADASRLHRIEEAFAIQEFEKHGFQVVTRSDVLRRPDDARDQLTYEGPIVGKTDRFVLVLRKQGSHI